MHTTHIHMYEATNKQKTSGRDSNQTVNSSHIGWEVGWDGKPGGRGRVSTLREVSLSTLYAAALKIFINTHSTSNIYE